MRTAPPRPTRYAKPTAPKRAATGLTPAVRRAIVSGAKAGIPWPVIAAKSGVSPHQIRRWRTRGKELSDYFAEHGKLPDDATVDDMDCLRFYDEVEVAHNCAIEKFAKTINKAGAKSWVAAAWWLERCASGYYTKGKPETEETKPQAASAQKVMLYLPDNGRDPQ